MPIDISKADWKVDMTNERALLSRAYKDINSIRGKVDITDFLFKPHKILYWCFLQLSEEKKTFSFNNLNAVSKSCEIGQDFGGEEYLNKIKETPTEGDDTDLLVQKLIKDRVAHDGVIEEIVPSLLEIAFEPTTTINDIHDFLIKSANELSNLSTAEVLYGNQLVKEYKEEFERRLSSHRINTGLKTLDERLTWGFSQGSVTVLAGRTSMGKSTFAINMALGFIRNGHGVLFATLETDETSLINRMLSRMIGVDANLLISGSLSVEDKKKKEEALEELGRLNFATYDKRGCSMAELESVLLKTKAIKPIDVIVIDLFSYTRDAAGETRDLENAIKEVRTFAQRHNVHVILVVQIQRRAEDRKDKRPEMRDLKWSGAYEEVADIVLLLHREDVYKKREGSQEGLNLDNILEVNIAKQRDGDIRTVRLHYDDARMLVEDITSVDMLAGDDFDGKVESQKFRELVKINSDLFNDGECLDISDSVED